MIFTWMHWPASLATFFTSAGIPPPPSPELPPADLHIAIDGIRSDRGVVRYCLARRAVDFPSCKGKDVITGTAAIMRRSTDIHVQALPPGNYAIAVFHDANGNHRLDTIFGIPREGFGFSRNPPLAMRAPTFDETVLRIAGQSTVRIRLRYLF